MQPTFTFFTVSGVYTVQRERETCLFGMKRMVTNVMQQQQAITQSIVDLDTYTVSHMFCQKERRHAACIIR